MIDKRTKAGNWVFFVTATAFLGLITAVIGMTLYLGVSRMFMD